MEASTCRRPAAELLGAATCHFCRLGLGKTRVFEPWNPDILATSAQATEGWHDLTTCPPCQLSASDPRTCVESLAFWIATPKGKSSSKTSDRQLPWLLSPMLNTQKKHDSQTSRCYSVLQGKTQTGKTRVAGGGLVIGRLGITQTRPSISETELIGQPLVLPKA